MNPYDFVPIVEANKPEQRRPEGHDTFCGKRGFIECKISTRKPIIIPHPMDNEEREKRGLREPIERNNKVEYHEKYVLHRINGIPIIPGSSLKGVIRSVAEAAANSCVTFFVQKQNYSSKKFDPATEQTIPVDSQFRLPDGFYPCTDINKLCITCRLFGFQSSEKRFQGKVNISDAMARKGYKVLDCITLTELSSPKPHHKAFYALSLSDPDKIAGRKFYFHHKPDAHILPSREKTPRNSSVKPLDKGAIFDFKVSFTNLADDEYNLLLYSLFLEDGVCHKIGYGKPAGLGSVKIEALKLTLFLDTEKRYKRFISDDKEVYEGDELKTYITERTKSYREDKSANLEALRRIWKWPGEYDIQYPDFHEWFKIYPNEPISRTSEEIRIREDRLKETEKMKRGTRLEYKYQVALSFAGEDRTHAEKLAKLLKKRAISVFYDSYEQAELWGKDLHQHFQSVYRDKSQFCVVFLSQAYAKKLWTQHELKQAQARAFMEHREYILPVRIDDTEIPGISETTGYIDLRSTPVEEIADLIVKKLSP